MSIPRICRCYYAINSTSIFECSWTSYIYEMYINIQNYRFLESYPRTGIKRYWIKRTWHLKYKQKKGSDTSPLQ